MKLLIVGKTPPPIGGVTVHVQRLLSALNYKDIEYNFIYLKKNNLYKIFYYFFLYDVIHLHTSSPFLRCIFSVWSKLSFSKILITYHGDVGRFSFLNNCFDYLSIYFADYPLVLNEKSLTNAIKINKNTFKVSAFIPPDDVRNDLIVDKLIDDFISNYEYVFCTNAFNVSFDVNGYEIYGISSLIDIFNKNNEIGLIFSDPSGCYYEFLKNNLNNIPSNISIISFNHDFINVLKKTNAFIRATTTDGDSLSVKEALFLGKYVVASDCVSRPDGVFVYKTNDWDDCYKCMLKVMGNPPVLGCEIINAADELINIYKKAIQ